MPKPEIQLRQIHVNGVNMPSSLESSVYADDVRVVMRQWPEASIELHYMLTAENRFVVVPRLPNVTMRTAGRNNSRKFKIYLTGTHVVDQVKRIAQESDSSGIARILRPYLELTPRLRVEVANAGKQIEQGFTHVDRLMPINNLTIHGLALPFASPTYGPTRTYIIDGVEFGINRPGGIYAGISTSVRMPSRQSYVITRPGCQYHERPDLYLTVVGPSGVLRPTAEVLVLGSEIKGFLQGPARELNSPREVWAAIQKYYTYLRLNFRIKTSKR